MDPQTALTGLFLIIVGGAMEGAFSLPLKFTPRWAWENIWGAGSLMALLTVPWTLAVLTVPNLGEVYREASARSLVFALAFGAGWGIGGIFFGLAIARVGLSIGLTLIMGLIAIGGSVIPILMDRPSDLFRPGGLVLVTGIGVMIVGLRVCARAGALKERDAEHTPTPQVSSAFRTGLLFCVVAGLLSSLVNFALIFGREVVDVGVAKGVSTATAINAVWALVFTANYVVNIAFCGFLAARNRTIHRWLTSATRRYWWGALLMGLLWAGGIVVYGIGATMLGPFGAYFGFPIMLITSVLAGNLLGVVTGEWHGASVEAKRAMAAGVLLLAVAVGVLAFAGVLGS